MLKNANVLLLAFPRHQNKHTHWPDLQTWGAGAHTAFYHRGRQKQQDMKLLVDTLNSQWNKQENFTARFFFFFNPHEFSRD